MFHVESDMRGRTTRLICEALAWLSGGRDVCVVAHPANTAFRIVERILVLANEIGIPCEHRGDNGSEREGDVPVLFVRPLDVEPIEFPKYRPKPVVLIDHSAQHERQHWLPPSLRTVEAL